MNEKKNIIEYAIHYLSKYPKTEKEMRLQLLKKWYSEDEIDKAIKWLKKEKYIDDRLWAQMYLNSEVIKKWKPLWIVVKKLYHKGISKEIVNQLIKKMEEELQVWQINKLIKEINKLKQKWLEGFEIVKKLMSRGYSYDILKKAIDNL